MALESPRPSLKEIARRVSVTQTTSRGSSPSQPPLQLKGDTVRPVMISSPPPPPPDHPGLKELAALCERTVQEGTSRKQGSRLAPVVPRMAPLPAPKNASRWAAIAPVAAGAVIATAAIATAAVMLMRPKATAGDNDATAAVVVETPAAHVTRTPAAAATQHDPVESPVIAEVVATTSRPAPRAMAGREGRPADSTAQPSAADSTAVSPGEIVAEPDKRAEQTRPEDLAGAMAAAVKPAAISSVPASESAAKAAAPDDGSIPETPPQGAISAALAGAREAARACVAGMEEPSRATVVFASNGGVSRVDVTGPAAGGGAESCIRAALSGAKVAPFRRSSFSVGLTLRP